MKRYYLVEVDSTEFDSVGWSRVVVLDDSLTSFKDFENHLSLIVCEEFGDIHPSYEAACKAQTGASYIERTGASYIERITEVTNTKPLNGN